MNKKKRIKELEERVAQLERARSIHNEYWQTHIVGLEQRIEESECRFVEHLYSWYKADCPPRQEPQITYIWPATTDANIAGS